MENISVQGPIVIPTLTRLPLGFQADDNQDLEVLNLTKTGTNLLKITNILKNIIKRFAQRSQEAVGAESELPEASSSKKKIKKDKSVN